MASVETAGGSAWAAVLAVLTFAVDVGGNAVTLLHLIALVVVLPLGWLVGKRIGRMVRALVRRALMRRAPLVTVGAVTSRQLAPSLAILADIAGSVARYFTVFVAWIIGLELVGLDLAVFKVVAGVFALGVPFAVTLIARNGVAGLVLAGERTVQVGYLVKLASGHVGRVGVGNLFRTPVHAGGSTVYVPSGDLLGNVVEVLSTDEWAPVSVRLYVDAGNDLADVKAALVGAWVGYMSDISDRGGTVDLVGQVGADFSVVAYDVTWETVRPSVAAAIAQFLNIAFLKFDDAGISVPGRSVV